MADKRLRDLLYPALQKLGLISDYIVEQGTSGIWHYEKWASGKAKLTGKNTYSSATFTATGNVYYRNLPSINFPANLFIDNPYCVNVTPYMGNVGAAEVGSVSKSAIIVTVVSAVSRARGVTVYFSIEGYWKIPLGGGITRRLVKEIVSTFKGGVCYG